MGTVTANRESYSVQEDITSFDPSSPSGGVGQLTYTARDYPGSHRSLREVVTLDDPGRGRFEAVIRDLSSGEGALSVTADGALSNFNEWHAVPTFTGTLTQYVNLLASITDTPNAVYVDPAIASTQVTVTGYRGNVWDNFRLFISANQWECAQVFSRIVVRPMRTINAYDTNIISESRTLNIQTPSPKFSVNWYESKWTNSGEFYPVPSNTTDSVIVVDAATTIVQEYDLDGSLLSVNQPVVQDYVNNTSYAGTNGVYAVSGNDGLPITAAQWRNNGGALSVKIGDDPRTLVVTVQGANIPHLSPFRIAMTAGTSSYYNALHVTGVGVQQTVNTMTFMSGEPSVNNGTEIGQTIDNPFIQTQAQAVTASLYVMKSLAGPVHTLSGSTFALNQPNANPDVVAASIGDFNSAYPAMTIAGFNSVYAGQTIEQFNSYWETLTSETFNNQLFGQGIGARLVRDDVVYRVTSTSTGPDVVNYDAVSDTTIGDFNGRYAGATIAEFNERYAGQRIQDYNITPLRLVPSIPVEENPSPFPGPSTFPSTSTFPI